LIDDEAAVREVAQVSLELMAGWDVLAAASGPEGLAQATAEQPDAILLDVMMPDMDGQATLEALRASPTTRHIPVVLLSAIVPPTDQPAFTDLRAAGVIAKPFDALTLAGQVADLLGWET
jgi:CheY-like chemotaxis protein